MSFWQRVFKHLGWVGFLGAACIAVGLSGALINQLAIFILVILIYAGAVKIDEFLRSKKKNEF
jgi:hypothetical protein